MLRALWGRSTRPKSPRSLLRLEELGDRIVPDGTGTAVSPPPSSPAPTTLGFWDTAGVWLSAPVISDFKAEELSIGLFKLYGQVLASNYTGMVITLQGGYTLTGKTISVQADGSFSMIFSVLTDGRDTSVVYATTSNQFGISNTAATYVNPTMG